MKEKKEVLLSYMQANVAPILVDFMTGEEIGASIILDAKIEKTELNGHYEGLEYCPPNWFTKNPNLLVIDKIDKIDKEEQLKFYELLKYRKISTFELSPNCIIIVTAKETKKIHKELYSLMAQI